MITEHWTSQVSDITHSWLELSSMLEESCKDGEQRAISDDVEHSWTCMAGNGLGLVKSPEHAVDEGVMEMVW